MQQGVVAREGLHHLITDRERATVDPQQVRVEAHAQRSPHQQPVQVDLPGVGGQGDSLAHPRREPGPRIWIGPHATGGLDELRRSLEVGAPDQQIDVTGGTHLRVRIVEGGHGQPLEHPHLDPAGLDQVDHLEEAPLLPQAGMGQVDLQLGRLVGLRLGDRQEIGGHRVHQQAVEPVGEGLGAQLAPARVVERVGRRPEAGVQPMSQHPSADRRQVVVPARRSLPSLACRSRDHPVRVPSTLPPVDAGRDRPGWGRSPGAGRRGRGQLQLCAPPGPRAGQHPCLGHGHRDRQRLDRRVGGHRSPGRGAGGGQPGQHRLRRGRQPGGGPRGSRPGPAAEPRCRAGPRHPRDARPSTGR